MLLASVATPANDSTTMRPSPISIWQHDSNRTSPENPRRFNACSLVFAGSAGMAEGLPKHLWRTIPWKGGLLRFAQPKATLRSPPSKQEMDHVPQAASGNILVRRRHGRSGISVREVTRPLTQIVALHLPDQDGVVERQAFKAPSSTPQEKRRTVTCHAWSPCDE